MTRRRDKSRRDGRAQAGDRSSCRQSSALFPSLNQLAKEIRDAQSQFGQLGADNQRLRERLDKQGQELVQAQQQVTDLQIECDSLKQRLKLAEAEVERSHTNALVSLFKDMADERHNRLLRKLLAFEGNEPGLTHDIAHYLRENVNLSLEGERGIKVTLTDENIDHYELQESVTLPCRAQVIGRGISFKGQPILRVQVELVEEEVGEEEKTNNGN